MTSPTDPAIRSGAAHVDEMEHLASGLTEPKDVSLSETPLEDGVPRPVLETTLGHVTLSMFEQGTSVRVRVGDAHNASELYEERFSSAEEANTAMLDAGVLTQDQVPDPAQLAGTAIPLTGVTVQQLEAAGLKRHATSTL